jgi:hypothetical protein
MSTKTTFKRVALVAVAALGLGVLTSVAPASAARVTAEAKPCWVSTAPFGVLADGETATATASLTQVAGAANYVEITCDTDVTSGTTAVVSTSGAGSTLAVSGSTATWTVATGAGSAVSSSADISSAVVRVYTPTAGTVTTTVAKRSFTNGAATDTTLQTFTITVTAAGVANVYSAANSTVYAASGTTTPTSTTDAAVIATPVSLIKTLDGTTEALKIVVDQEDANDVNLTTAVANSVTIVGVGNVGLAVDTPLGQYASETAQGSDFYIFADGRSGKGTVTVSVNGVVAKTYVVNFYGAVATLTATPLITNIAKSATTAGVIEVVAKDANGFVVPSVSITGTASNTTDVTAVTAAGDGDADGDQLVGLTTASTAKGAYTFTFTDGTITSAAVSVTVGNVTATTVKLTTDKAEYNAGEKITVTVTATDSNGNAVADGAVALFGTAGVTSTSALQGALPASSVTLVAGKATYTAYAPLASGPVTISGTEGTGTDSTTKATISATFTVLSDGVAQSAADAAAEATDAANAATDAANAAAEAADAATAAAQDAADAVAALSVQVSEQIAALQAQNEALRKQLVALTNLIIKIQKKVKA